jgi:hypothetical protein
MFFLILLLDVEGSRSESVSLTNDRIRDKHPGSATLNRINQS